MNAGGGGSTEACGVSAFVVVGDRSDAAASAADGAVAATGDGSQPILI
jgi:hypothetical protein